MSHSNRAGRASRQSPLTVVELELDLIRLDPTNPRGVVGDVSALADSIREYGGVKQPIYVRPEGAHYVVFEGNRRVTAAREVGLKTIPAIISYVGADAAMELALMLNNQREAIPTDRFARLLRQLSEERKADGSARYTQRQLAAMFGYKSHTTIGAMIRGVEDIEKGSTIRDVAHGQARNLVDGRPKDVPTWVRLEGDVAKLAKKLQPIVEASRELGSAKSVKVFSPLRAIIEGEANIPQRQSLVTDKLLRAAINQLERLRGLGYCPHIDDHYTGRRKIGLNLARRLVELGLSYEQACEVMLNYQAAAELSSNQHTDCKHLTDLPNDAEVPHPSTHFVQNSEGIRNDQDARLATPRIERYTKREAIGTLRRVFKHREKAQINKRRKSERNLQKRS